MFLNISIPKELISIYLFPYPACPAILDPPNGAVTWTSLTEGGVATYVCDDGFELEGNMTRTCESSDMWSGEEPMCRGTCTLINVTYYNIIGHHSMACMPTAIYIVFHAETWHLRLLNAHGV